MERGTETASAVGRWRGTNHDGAVDEEMPGVKTARASPDTARAGTGIAGLDEILGGGLPRNPLYLVEGGTGAGKTTLGLQFLLAGAARGERALYPGFAETPEDIEKPDRLLVGPVSALRWFAADPFEYRRHMESLGRAPHPAACTTVLIDDATAAEHQFHPRSLAHGVLITTAVEPEYGRSRRRLRIEKLRGEAVLSGHHDYEIQTGGVAVYPRIEIASKSRARVDGAPLLADRGDFRELLGGGVPYLDLQLHQLLDCLRSRGIITVMVLTQRGLLGDSYAPVDLSYLSDVTVLTRFFEARASLHRAVSVVKHREYRHERSIRELIFDDDGIRLGEPLSRFRGLLTGTPLYED